MVRTDTTSWFINVIISVYRTQSRDKGNGSRGGTVVIVKSNIEHHELTELTEPDILTNTVLPTVMAEHYNAEYQSWYSSRVIS